VASFARHDPGPAPARVMARRGVGALAAGVVVAGAYLGGAALSGHLSVSARRPLLDGLSPPPPYRWVKPPPSLAASNQAPLSGEYAMEFNGGKSVPGVFRTDDSQAVIILLTGAIPAEPGKTSVTLTLHPLAPGAVGPPPAGYSIAGNVYRVRGVYQPGGPEVTSLTGQNQIVLVYPTPVGHPRHTLLFSPDGKSWRTLPSVDSPFQQQVSDARVDALGYYAVAVRGSAGAAAGSSSGSVIPFIVGAVALLVLMAVVVLEVRRRQRQPPSRPGRHPPEPRPRR